MAETAKAVASVRGAGMGMMDQEGKYLSFALREEKRAFAPDRPGSEFRENSLRSPAPGGPD